MRLPVSPSARPALPVRSRAAFVLVEVMIAVAIFAMGMIALGRCIDNCVTAEIIKNDTERARLALENRMAEIESGEVRIQESQTDALKGMFSGITLRQVRTPLKLKNEDDQDVVGLYQIDMEAGWKSGGQDQKRTLSFYVFQP